MNRTRSGSIALVLAGHILIHFGAWQETLRFLLPCGAATAFFGLALAWRGGERSLPLIFSVALALRLSFLGIPAGALSDDVFRYVWDGQLTVAGLNAFETTPSQAHQQGFGEAADLDELNSPDYFSVYPPVSQGLFAAAALTDFPYLAIRLILGIFEFCALLLLSRLVQNRHLIFYAWNPLVVLETWGQAHTEAALLATLVLMLWAIRQNRFLLATISLTLAVWIKLWPVFFLPFLLRHAGWRIRDAAAFLGLSAALWLPFQPLVAIPNLLQSLRLYVDTFEFNAGPYYLVKWIAEAFIYGLDWIPDHDARLFVGVISRIAMLIALVWLFCRRRAWVIEHQLAIVAAIVLLSLPTIHPWYLLPVFLVLSFFERIEWAWIWLGSCSAGTYLLYTSGAPIYWVFVALGWIGWALLMFVFRKTGGPLFFPGGIAHKPEPEP